MYFCQECHKNVVVSSMHHIEGFMMLIYLIMGDDYLDHLVNLASAKFSHCKIIIFSFVVEKHLR